MPKLFIYSLNTKNCRFDKVECLIPDVFNFKSQLVGIESGKIYDVGIVMYSIVEIEIEIILKKVEFQHSFNFLKKRKAKRILKSYLKQISTFQNGTKIKIDVNYNLQHID